MWNICRVFYGAFHRGIRGQQPQTTGFRRYKGLQSHSEFHRSCRYFIYCGALFKIFLALLQETERERLRAHICHRLVLSGLNTHRSKIVGRVKEWAAAKDKTAAAEQGEAEAGLHDLISRIADAVLREDPATGRTLQDAGQGGKGGHGAGNDHDEEVQRNSVDVGADVDGRETDEFQENIDGQGPEISEKTPEKQQDEGAGIAGPVRSPVTRKKSGFINKNTLNEERNAVDGKVIHKADNGVVMKSPSRSHNMSLRRGSRN